MNPYEMTFIIRPDRDEDGTRAAVETVVGRISSAGGEIIAAIPWNPPRRRMAYTIRDFGDGFYITTVFRVDPTALPAIENWLKLNDTILRFMIVQATELNIKQAVQRLQQQQAPAPQPVAQPAPEGSVPQAQPLSPPVESDRGETQTDGSSAASETQAEPISDTAETAPVVPPVVAEQPIVGTEAADAATEMPPTGVDAASELSPVEEDVAPEPAPVPVAARPVAESQE